MAKRKKARKPQAKTTHKPVAKQGITFPPQPSLPKPLIYGVIAVAAIAIIALLWLGSSPAPFTPAPQALAPGPGPQAEGTVFTIIKDATCAVCNSNNVADVMRTAFSGITIREIDSGTAEAQQLIQSLGIKALPGYVFNAALSDEENFSQFEPALREAGGLYAVDERVRGLIVRYFTPPSVEGEPATAESGLAIIEFADPACGACKTFNLQTKPMLNASYGDKIRIVFKSMPLSPDTLNASIAMDCAGEQGKFWEYTKMLYEGSIADLDGYAADLGLNVAQFANCTASQKYLDEVMGDRAEGVEYGVSGTPTLFINGIKITGVPADTDIKRIIDAELAQ